MSDARTPSVNPDGSDPTPIAELEPNNRAGSASSSGRGRRVVTAALLTSMLAGAGAVALIVNNGDATPKAERTARKLAKLHLRSGSAPLSAGAAHDEGFKRSAMPYANFEYTHSGAWPDLAKTATVYKVNAPTVDQAAAERIARAVGIPDVA